jgi:hypothetical protein
VTLRVVLGRPDVLAARRVAADGAGVRRRGGELRGEREEDERLENHSVRDARSIPREPGTEDVDEDNIINEEHRRDALRERAEVGRQGGGMGVERKIQ